MPQRLLLNKRISPEFLAQRAAVDAEYAGGLALVAPCKIHNGFKQRPFYFTDDKVVQVTRAVAVKCCEILIQCVFGVPAKRFLAMYRRKSAALIIFGHDSQIPMRSLESRAFLPKPQENHAAKETPPSCWSKYSLVNLICSEALSTRTT